MTTFGEYKKQDAKVSPESPEFIWDGRKPRLAKEQDAVFRAAQRQEGLKELLNSEVAKLKQGGTGLTSQTPIRPDAGTVMKKGFWYLDPTDGQVKQWDGTRLK